MRRIAVLLAVCFTLAGCGGGGYGSGSKSGSTTASSGAAAARKTVQISEKEFLLTPGTVDVAQPETVAFKVTNNGQIGHALEVEGSGVKAETDTIEPGEAATITVHFSKSGNYEMYCPIDGHEGKGMKGSITVRGSAAGGGMTTTEDTTTNKGPGY
jgi:uncharacterized cupredoxin-like copper-binding protein